VCYIPSKANEPPAEENRSNWATLFPDTPYILEATLKPPITTAPIAAWTGITVEEMKAIQAQQLLLTKWRHVEGFEDGETYEVGIRESIALSSWLHGSFDEILEMSKAGTAPELQKELIPCKVSQSAKFVVKRPDADESLNYWGI
jgi:hypothetical protein